MAASRARESGYQATFGSNHLIGIDNETPVRTDVGQECHLWKVVDSKLPEILETVGGIWRACEDERLICKVEIGEGTRMELIA